MSNEWLEDARKIPDEVMSYLRKIAVRAIVEEGYSPELISAVFGISRTAIYEWLRRFRKEGYCGLETRQSPGAPPVITAQRDEWLKKTVLACTPMDFGYDTVLWTRDLLAEVFNEHFKTSVGGSTIGLHLERLGLSYQKPWFRANEQDPQKVERFLTDTFPRIQKLAEKMGADIAFEDEAGIRLEAHGGKTWGERGHTPEVLVTGKRGGYNLLSIVLPGGKLLFSIEEGTINSERYISFLKQVLKGRTKPLILIVDGASFHRTKKVRDFVRSHRQQIRMFFFPKYSPELNPDEQVWNTIKAKGMSRKAPKNKSELRKKVESALR